MGIIHPQFLFIVIIPLTITICTLFVYYKHLSTELKALLVLLVIYFFMDVALGWINKTWRVNTIWIVNLLTVVRLPILFYIFKSWTTSKNIAQSLSVVLIAFLIFWGVAKLTFEPIMGFHYITGSIGYIIIFVYSLLIAMRPYKNQEPILWNAQFWVLCSLILYSLPALGVAAVQKFLSGNMQAILVIYYAKWITSGLSYFMIAWAGICEKVTNPAPETTRRSR